MERSRRRPLNGHFVTAVDRVIALPKMSSPLPCVDDVSDVSTADFACLLIKAIALQGLRDYDLLWWPRLRKRPLVVFVLYVRAWIVIISKRQPIRGIKNFKVIHHAAGLRLRSDAFPQWPKNIQGVIRQTLFTHVVILKIATEFVVPAVFVNPIRALLRFLAPSLGLLKATEALSQ